MSQENVEIVRRGFDAWNRGDIEGFRAYISPEWEWHPARMFPGTDTVYHGAEGFTRFWKTFRAPWESMRAEAERIEDLGDRVLALMTLTGRRKGSDVEVTSEYANVFTLRDGLVIYQVGFDDWKTALKAVGLAQ